MTTTLTGTDSYSNTATAPADGDTRNAASVNTPLQTILNNTRYLYQHGRVRDIQFNTSAASESDTDTNWNTVTNGTLTFSNCEVGDVIIFAASYQQYSSAGVVNSRLIIVDGATTAAGIEQPQVGTSGPGVQTAPMTLLHARTVVTAGTVTCQLQHQSVGGVTSNVGLGQLVAIRFSQV